MSIPEVHMRSTFVLVLTLLLVQMSSSQPLCDFRGIDSLFAQNVGDTTTIWDLSLCAYCSSKFSVSVSVSHDSIFIVQTDTVIDVALCDCIFDQRTSIVGLQPGGYWVILERRFPAPLHDSSGGHIVFVGAIHFERPTKTGKIASVSADSGDVSWSSFQTGCIPDLVVDDVSQVPSQFSLSQNYPNPFNPSTTIQFRLQVASFVVIKVFDMLGREIRTLLAEHRSPGTHSLSFNLGPEPSSGIYYCRMVAGSFAATRRLVLLR